MDSIFEVEYMYPVTGAVQVEVTYVWAYDAKEAIKAVELYNKWRIRKDEYYFLGVQKIREPEEKDYEVITREKWEEENSYSTTYRPFEFINYVLATIIHIFKSKIKIKGV